MIRQLAKLLRVPERAAEDAMHSEKLARAVLSRRAFMGGGLALMATGVKMVPGSDIGGLVWEWTSHSQLVVENPALVQGNLVPDVIYMHPRQWDQLCAALNRPDMRTEFMDAD